MATNCLMRLSSRSIAESRPSALLNKQLTTVVCDGGLDANQARRDVLPE